MDFIEALKGVIRTQICGILAVQSTTIGFVEKLTPFGLGPYPSIVRSLRRSVCSNPENNLVVPAVPIPHDCGCAGTWNVRVRFQMEHPTTPGRDLSFPGFENQNPYVAINPLSGSPGARYSALYSSCTGAIINDTINTIPNDTGSVVFSQFIKTDPNCVSPPPPPPTLVPYNPTPVNTPVTYDGPSGPVTENFDITVLPPVLVAPFTIVAPVLITGNNINLTLEVNLTGNFDIKFQPTFTFGRDGYGTGNPPPGSNQPPDDGKESNDRKIIGALVITTDSTGGRASLIGQGDNPNIYAPRLGNINFLVATDKGRGWTPDQSVKNTRCYIPCPAPQGAVDVRGTPDTGYDFDVIAIYDRPEFDVP